MCWKKVNNNYVVKDKVVSLQFILKFRVLTYFGGKGRDINKIVSKVGSLFTKKTLSKGKAMYVINKMRTLKHFYLSV